VRNVSGFDVRRVAAVRGRIFDKCKHTKYRVHLYFRSHPIIPLELDHAAAPTYQAAFSLKRTEKEIKFRRLSYQTEWKQAGRQGITRTARPTLACHLVAD
jgi:hypothetical protein